MTRVEAASMSGRAAGAPALGGAVGTAGAAGENPGARARRIELILRQIDALPTLPVIATRLLALTADHETHAREVVELISSDQALTAKILSLCRQANLGVRSETLTVERAVVLLGFNAVRNAVLSVQVYDFFSDSKRSRAGSQHESEDEEPALAGAPNFDRVEFWRHCLAVAVIAELIANAHPNLRDVNAGEAFVCGLLHDFGKLALDNVLPKAYARVLELVDINQGSIAEFERKILGIDHHTAGKRLAEQWQLPHVIQDCIWLHGSKFDLLPNFDHRRMIGLISLADLIARRQHLGFSGNYAIQQHPLELAEQIGFDAKRIEDVLPRIPAELEKRSEALGLAEAPSVEMFVQSVQRANHMLGRMNEALERRNRTAAQQTKILEAITNFQRMRAPGQGVEDVLSLVVQNAVGIFGEGFYGMIYQSSPGESWLIEQYNTEGRAVHGQWMDPPRGTPDLQSLDPAQPLSLNLLGLLPWLTDYLIEAPDLRQVKILPLPCGWGTSAVLLHDRPALPEWRQLEALTFSWGSAVAAAAQHDGARRLGEQLADANRALAEAQDQLLQQRSMARLGEMAAGAAHEMNNPLTIISGRAQLLTRTLQPGCDDHMTAQTIVNQSHRLSDLITALRMYADPPKPKRQVTTVANVMDDVARHVYEQLPRKLREKPISVQVQSSMPDCWIDPDQINEAVRELLLNALQANPKSGVTLSAKHEPRAHALVIRVVDDGCGMDEYTLSHAMDPFFSAKPAGRQVGMGLCRAQQLVNGHNGKLDLRSTDGKGTTATITLPLDSDH